MKYLICDSKAQAMGISRETYIAFVEAMGIYYKTNEQPTDAYGVIQLASNGTAVLVVDETKPYFDGLEEQYKSNLLTDAELEARGIVLFNNEENPTPRVYPPSLSERLEALESVMMDLLI